MIDDFMNDDGDQDDEPQDEDGNEEIDFDQLLGDAAQSQADYEEDRDDSEDDEAYQVAGGHEETKMPDGMDSLAFSNTG